MDGTSLHHATDAMRCAACGTLWPCPYWAQARVVADRRAQLGHRVPPTVVYPERQAGRP